MANYSLSELELEASVERKKKESCGDDYDTLSRRDLIGLAKPRVSELKAYARPLDQGTFTPMTTRLYLPRSTQEAIEFKPWRIQLFDLEEFQGKFIHTRLFTSFIKATLPAHGETSAESVRAAVEAAVNETLSEIHLLPMARRGIVADRVLRRRSEASWVVEPIGWGVSELASMNMTAAAAHMKKRILRFDYTHRDGSVLTRRVRVHRCSKAIGSYWNGNFYSKSPVGFVGERHGQFREYRFERCSNMYVERLSVKKLQPEFEILLEPDDGAAILTLKLADD